MTDQKAPERLAWGLNLLNPEVTTQAEIDEFRATTARMQGGQPGLEYWLDEDPEVLKRYRFWSDQLAPPRPGAVSPTWRPVSLLIQYSQHGFIHGLKYGLLTLNRSLTKAQALEFFSLAFRYTGPMGMANLAEAARDHVWTEPAQPANWLPGWAPDPEAFRSGIDFTSPTLSAKELQLIEEWYERVLGEVPGHVRFLGRNRPEVLKAYRSRFENTLRLLPKEVEPYLMIEVSTSRAFPQGIREGVLMARGFGMAKADILDALNWGTFFGGSTSLLDLLDECGVTEIVEAWKDPSSK